MQAIGDIAWSAAAEAYDRRLKAQERIQDNRRALAHDRVLDYVLAGYAVLTLVNPDNGNHLTYLVRTPKGKGTPHFVYAHVGCSSNLHHGYAFIGTIFGDRSFRTCQQDKPGMRLPPDALKTKAFQWFWEKLRTGSLPERIEVWHEGRCGRCGQPLQDFDLDVGLHFFCPGEGESYDRLGTISRRIY